MRFRSILRPTAFAAFALLAATLVLGRFPFPGVESFGFASLARNLFLVVLVGHLLRVPGLRIRRSRIGDALLACLAAATLSVIWNEGSWGHLRLFASAIGIFFVARALADGPDGARILFHWLGLVCVGIVAREILSAPRLLEFREAARIDLVTDHPNTLGYLFAVLGPIFLAGALGGPDRRWSALYAIADVLGALLTFSRASWAGLVLGTIVVLLWTRPRRVAIAVGLIAASGALAVATATGLLSLGRSEADLQRLRIIDVSLSLFAEHWATGVGFGSRNLGAVFPGRYLERFGNSLFLFHSHNLLVDVLVGTGVIGALALAWLATSLARSAGAAVIGARTASEHRAAVACAASVAVFFLVSLVDTPFHHGRLMTAVAVLWAWLARLAGDRVADPGPAP